MKKKIKEEEDFRTQIKIVPINQILAIESDNVREEYSPEGIDGLAESLRTKGQLQSILVSVLDEPGPEGEKYKLVAGYRRYIAAKQACIQELFCIIRKYSDPTQASAVNVAENIEREDVPLFSYVKRIRDLLLSGWTAEKISKETGIDLLFCSKLVELSVGIAPEILENLKYDESPKMIARMQWAAKHIKGYSEEDKFKKQIEWWNNEGWRDLEPKKERAPRSASPDKIIDLAERFRTARVLEGSRGLVRFSEEQAEAIAEMLSWCASPGRKRSPL